MRISYEKNTNRMDLATPVFARGLFDVFYGQLKTAPMVNECALNIECKLVDAKELDTMDLIIGEIVQIYCEEKGLSDGHPDYKKIDPLLFLMPDGPYLKTGNVIAKAFDVGKDEWT